MSRLFSKHLAMIMIVIFMANSCIWNFHSNWLAHEIEHHVQLMPMAMTDDYAASQVSNVVDDKNQELSTTIEHQLLHAADHLQLFATAFSDSVFLFVPGVVFSHFTSIAVPHATSEAPFRPPRFLHFFTFLI